MPNDFQIIAGTVPQGVCPPGTAQEHVDLVAKYASIGANAVYILATYSETPPGPDAQDRPWITPTGYLYTFVNGVWARPHPVPPGAPVSILYSASEGSIETFDGGSSGLVTSTTGPMWERDTDMNGRFPLGVSSDYPLGSTGGNSEITQTGAQVGSHSHLLTVPSAGTTGTGGFANASSNPTQTVSTRTNQDPDDVEPMNIMNPYRARFWIKRTARIYYTA